MSFKAGDKIMCERTGITGIVRAYNKSAEWYTINDDYGNDAGIIFEDSAKLLIINNNQFPSHSNINIIVPKDSETSSTGSLRFNKGKSQCNEIDPQFILNMGKVMEKSRDKYPRANWQKGNNYSVPYDSLMRHILAWQSGEKLDKESQLPHLAHAALNLMMLAYYEEHYPEFDDRIFKKKEEK